MMSFRTSVRGWVVGTFARAVRQEEPAAPRTDSRFRWVNRGLTLALQLAVGEDAGVLLVGMQAVFMLAAGHVAKVHRAAEVLAGRAA